MVDRGVVKDGVEHWWQRAVIYQVYPRSFQDTNGDGIGDLRGIVQRLDHLVGLGVDTVWLSPIYPSPMADFGYDVSDYCDVDERFGRMADFDALVAALRARGMRLVLDFVPNHTSDQHPWFVTSRASRTNSKRDWYIWRDPASDGGPPNNWLSHFGGGAWEFDRQTGQYYLHSFLKEQPDLNWRNPAVKQAMFDVLRFWLDRGVDGFRVDVLWCLIKDERLRDNPPNPDWHPGQTSRDKLLSVFDCDRPEVHDVVAEMRAVLDRYGDRLLIGEIYLPIEQLVTYYGRDGTGAQMPFNFTLIKAGWTAANIARIVTRYYAALPAGAWPNWVLSNHDQSRIGTRIGERQARIAAMLLLTLRGTPTIYYGEEIGMLDASIPPDEVQDPAEKRQPGIGLGRDPERTPMQWDASPQAGFTTGRPWLPLAADHALRNVATEQGRPDSMLAFYRGLLALRHRHAALVGGTIADVVADGDLLSYTRRDGDEGLRVILNFGSAPRRVELTGTVLLATRPDMAGTIHGAIQLGGDEGVVVLLA